MGAKKQRAEKRATQRRRWVWLLVYALLGCGIAAAAAYGYRELYPLEQRCPPQNDRFHEHCTEGRKHYQIEIDWSCLGRKRAKLMQMALGVQDAGDVKGVGWVPSWLTQENADIVRQSPCINRLSPDTACRHCAPTPKPLNATSAGADDSESGAM